jgi:hypothetical protein
MAGAPADLPRNVRKTLDAYIERSIHPDGRAQHVAAAAPGPMRLWP